jgi:hypothetical protein
MPHDPIVDLIGAVVAHMVGDPPEWTSFSMVIGLAGGRLSGTSGFAYASDGAATPVASRPSAIKPALDAFLADRFGPDGRLPVQMLVQYDRERRRYELTFEDTDATRWKVTPMNVDEMPEQLRPRLR